MSRCLLLAIVLSACTSVSTPEPEPVVEPAPAPEVPAWKILAPSPLELEGEVAEAGVTGLAELVPKTMPDISSTDKDRAAVQTGIVAAYTVLGGRAVDKPQLLAQVRAMRAGMKTVGAGEGLLKSIDRYIEQIENDTAAREDFLKELDAQVQSSVPEEGWGPGDTTGPLLQAGAWLAGINLVSRKIVEMGDASAADTLLKREEVARFFLEYISGAEGSEKAGATSDAVARALTELAEVAGRETIGTDGAREIADTTGKLLELM